MDPIGTQGAAKGPPRDLDVAPEGGPDFFSRLKMIAAAKDEAAQAYARLKIGNDVIAARADAEEQLRRAEEQLRRAEETKAAADEYSERARKEADGYVTVVRQDADKYPARLREEIDVAKAQVEETKQRALTEQAEVKQNKAELERLIAENTEKQRALDAKTAKFKSGLLELKREFGSDGDELSVPPLTEASCRRSSRSNDRTTALQSGGRRGLRNGGVDLGRRAGETALRATSCDPGLDRLLDRDLASPPADGGSAETLQMLIADLTAALDQKPMRPN